MTQAYGFSVSYDQFLPRVLQYVPDASEFIAFQNFQAKTKLEVIKLINEFINGFFKGKLKNVNGTSVDSNNGRDLTLINRFPFYFRPTLRLSNILTDFGSSTTSTNIEQITNVQTIMSGIRLFDTKPTPGYSLVYDESGKSQAPIKPNKQTIIPENVSQIDETVAIMGGKTLYLLSHNSTIPNKVPITLGDETVYGIDINTITDIIEPNTSSMVRGEELMELLNLIVKFLISHVHPYPGMSPVPVASDGTKSADILQQILNAQQTILNSNIKLN